MSEPDEIVVLGLQLAATSCSIAGQPSFEDTDSMARFGPVILGLIG